MSKNNPAMPVINEAHLAMVETIIKESSIEALLDLISDHALARAGLHKARPSPSQMQYRELGPKIGAAIAVAAKWSI